MDNSEGIPTNASKKRSISPVINKDDLKEKVEVEADILIGSEEKTWDTESVKRLLKSQILEKHVLQAKYAAVRDDRRDLENKVAVLESKLNVAESKLAARPNLEIIQGRIIPTWLTGKSYLKYQDKLIVSLYFDLTPTAKLIRERMDDYSQICLFSVVDAMILFYEALSAKISHDGKPEMMSLTNKEWIQLCREVEFKDPFRIGIIQKLMAPVEMNEIDGYRVALRYHFIYVNHMNINVAQNSEEETTKFIQNICGKDFTYGQFLYPVIREKYTNDVYFQIFTTEKDVAAIEKKLSEFPKAGKQVFFRSQFVQRV